VPRLKEKITRIKEQMRRLVQIGAQMQATPDRQILLTDPDARSMATSGRGTGMVGYNVQTVVDAKHHLIIAHEVTNRGHDRQQLAPMAQQAGQAIGHEHLTVLADRGYFNSEQIRKCEQGGIATLVPKPLTSNNKAAGLFDKRDFVYLPERNAALLESLGLEFTRQQGETMRKLISERMREMPAADFAEMLRTATREDEWLLLLHGAGGRIDLRGDGRRGCDHECERESAGDEASLCKELRHGILSLMTSNFLLANPAARACGPCRRH